MIMNDFPFVVSFVSLRFLSFLRSSLPLPVPPFRNFSVAHNGQFVRKVGVAGGDVAVERWPVAGGGQFVC